ncbi:MULTISPECIES: Holliday junction branch migration protein RuvA [unclassified Actinomyces]|uniref:Holliday junction branch migration protein RuvA n=1 Tax=unclassified Actinomyces TaxID=2609248 RepID=UPI0020182D2B|nr:MULTISPECIES: Holliday junction branch migration protein RuvA [unclassified Actinomyces]MCL3778348.1 Holliday junction branch migration protein RuvA [Actinomyces sp. AC-20-1]MCL3790205.1 Holliday junction branch migration protein RuvA [Actinomyces sp. 187325]MCL3792484.1 Holliday junction branch migration protein RuvA [Actinomyces sp. 186855]MCL3794320.1 Holliday junction branch migration protein RuvA [Actinomyces sp. 217892]
MIASLRGAVLETSLNSATIEVGGVGMTFQATPATLAGLRPGREALVHTELVVREDSLTLFGFADADERHCFRVLMGAKGVGARLALAVLSVHTPDSLRRAVAGGDVAALTRVPGLGPKGAQRVIIDVGDRLGPVQGEDPGPGTQVGAAQEEGPAPSPDVVAALVQLGWNEATAGEAVTAVEAAHMAAHGQEADPMPVPELLRASLRWLGGGHRG